MIITLIVALIVVPIIFNYVFMWESGWSRGETSDWFTLYGNIIGGLIGGFFTYLALMLTFKDQNDRKVSEMKPRIDIPHQTIEFKTDITDEVFYQSVFIELNNIGGSIAKNIECTLSLPNYDQVLSELEKDKQRLGVKFVESQITNLSNNVTESRKHLMVLKDNVNLGSLQKKYEAKFIGTCIPLVLNPEAKSHFRLEERLSQWICYIVQKRSYTPGLFNDKQLFNFVLEVKYSSEEYGDFKDTFNLEWTHNGIWADENADIKISYVLKSAKVA